MTLPIEPNIDRLTYTYENLRSDWFHLDRLLDRMAPVFSIDNSAAPIKELGALNVLPNELLLDVFDNLSIIDLMRFRRCNKCSSYFVDSIPSLRRVLRIAPNTIKGIMALQVSTHITAKQLCQKLCQRECDGCGTLAQCIYLPTCLRACFGCLHPDTGHHDIGGYFAAPLSEFELRVGYKLSPEEIAARPSFRPPLCTFTNGMNKFTTTERHILYDLPTKLLTEKLGWVPCFEKRLPRNDFLVTRQAKRASRMLKQNPNRKAITVVRDPIHIDLRKHMAVVIAPWADATALKAEQGVFCSACLGKQEQDWFYTRDMYLEHLDHSRFKSRGWCSTNERSPVLWLCEDPE